jgi:hypothetical protein
LEDQEDCESTIQFYSNKNDSWHSVDIGDDPYRYDNQGGFPAFKYFLKDKTHFLLIAGGIDSNFNTSSKIQILSFSLSHVDG